MTNTVTSTVATIDVFTDAVSPFAAAVFEWRTARGQAHPERELILKWGDRMAATLEGVSYHVIELERDRDQARDNHAATQVALREARNEIAQLKGVIEHLARIEQDEDDTARALAQDIRWEHDRTCREAWAVCTKGPCTAAREYVA